MADAAFYDAIPKRRLGSGVLIQDVDGSVLVVEPTYKDEWEIPGGIVEAGEDPRACCVREVLEELGIDIGVGRLLVIAHKTETPPRGDSIMFVYDGGVLGAAESLSNDPIEIRSVRFVPIETLPELMSARLAERVTFAAQAKCDGSTIETVNGKRVT